MVSLFSCGERLSAKFLTCALMIWRRASVGSSVAHRGLMAATNSWRELNNADERFRQPYYWAGFMLVGGHADY